MQLSETVLVEELDQLIHSAVLRIEQQGFHVEQSSSQVRPTPCPMPLPASHYTTPPLFRVPV
jgi:hypothetical protein